MSPVTAESTDHSIGLGSACAVCLTAFGALLLRDLRVFRKSAGVFAVRTIMQPLLLVFVFTYVFPKIGQGVGGSGRAESSFSTLLMAGVIATSMVMQGVQAVALPLVQEFGWTREIEDRVMAPLPIWAVAVEKIVAGALQALIAGLVVFPLAAFIPATPVHLHVHWVYLLTVAPIAALLGASLGRASSPNRCRCCSPSWCCRSPSSGLSITRGRRWRPSAGSRCSCSSTRWST